MLVYKGKGRAVSSMATAYINPTMLKWAREQTPFKTVDDVSKRKTTIDSGKLAAWEAGILSPSITAAKELAKLYKLPFAAFYLEVPPEKRVIKYYDRRTITGTLYRDNNYELWAETQRVNNNRDLIVELYNEAEIQPLTLPSFKLSATIDEITDSVRRFLGIQTPFRYKKTYGNNAFRYYRDLLEHHDICVAQINGVELAEMKGFSLAYDTIPIIGINGKDFERAKVFSLFHELAHIIRRTSSLCMINFDSRNDDEEKLCDKIAANILMPTAAFTTIANQIYKTENEWSSVCLMKIADRFGVSSASVILRLNDVKLITLSEYYSLYQMAQEGFEASQAKKNGRPRAEEHQKFLNKQGYLFSRTLLNAYGRGYITYGELCKTLSLNKKYIGNLERAVMFG